MPKCKSILCSNEAVPGHDFCLDCIEQYLLAILTGHLHAVEEDDCDEDCEDCPFDLGDKEAPLYLQYPQYYKDVTHLDVVDVYAVHQLFDVNDPSGAIQHASKKLLLSGVRTGNKSVYQDIKEARDTLNRWLEMNS